MKLRSLVVAALLVPGFAACDKKDAPAPAPAPAAAPAPALEGAVADPDSNDLIKRALEHHTKLAEALANSKGDVAAAKAALEAISAADVDTLNAALLKLGEDEAAVAKAKETYAAEIAAAKKAQDAAVAVSAALATDTALVAVAGKLTLSGIPNLVPESAEVAAPGELAGGSDKEGAEGAAVAADKWPIINGRYETFLKILEDNAADPAAAAAALTAFETAEGAEKAYEAFKAEFEKLYAEPETAGVAWSTGPYKEFEKRLQRLKADHPELFQNVTVDNALRRLLTGGRAE